MLLEEEAELQVVWKEHEGPLSLGRTWQAKGRSLEGGWPPNQALSMPQREISAPSG